MSIGLVTKAIESNIAQLDSHIINEDISEARKTIQSLRV